MKKRFIPLALTLALLLSLGTLVAAQSQDDTKFQKALDSFLDEYWEFYPTAATLAGYHKYDTQIEDWNEGTLEKRTDALDAFNKDFVSKINRSGLSPDNQIDLEIIIDTLEYDLFRHENLVPWEYNPLAYNEVILNSVKGLLGGNFASLDVRAKSALERLNQLPGFMKQAKENLKTPAQVYTETAIAQFPGIQKFYREELPKLIEGLNGETRAKINAETSKVLAALDDYQRFLSGTLLPKSTGKETLGDQAHLRLLRLSVQGSILQDQLTAQAKADANNIRREMALVCIPFYKVMYPEVNLDKLQRSEEEIRSLIIKGVLDKIKVEHSTKEEFLSKTKAFADSLKSFLEKNNVISAPAETPDIRPMPLEYQGITLTRLETPGAYETSGKYTIEVWPYPGSVDNGKSQSFLEEFNDFYMPFWTAARIYPGKFLPTYLSRKNSSLVRRLFPNQPLLLGWSLGVCEQLPFAGYGNYDLRLRLSQLKQQLKAVVDFQTELNVHQGSWTKADAVNYWTRVGFLTAAEAERMYNQVLLKPGEAAYTYIGMQEINDLEKEYKRLKGDAFNRKEFYEKILANGALPLRLLKAKLR